MPQISPPERGQPLDIDYLYEIAESINDINNQITVNNTMALSKVPGSDPNRVEAIRTSALKVFAVRVPGATGKVSVNVAITAPVKFTPDFQYTPIVSATPVIQNFKEESKNCIVTVQNVTPSGADIVMVFTKDANQVDVDVDIIAIGQG